MTDHKQVQFVTLNGHATLVDEGLLPVLNEMRRLGVRTQFSCQKDRKTAYVLSDRKTMRRLVKKIYRTYKAGGYSEESATVVQRFLRGYRSHEFSWFKSIPHGKDRIIETKMQRTISRGYHGRPCYSVEWLYSNEFKLRAVVRWPHKHTDLILQLLKETDPIPELSSKEALPGVDWAENRLSECEYGCKVYRQKGTDLEFVAHNSAYGCPK